jgi:6-phosphogluconate dehydrogenase
VLLKAMTDAPSDIGLIGLAVMGQNLALNIADHGFRISVYNRTTSTMEAFVKENPDTPGALEGYASLSEFVGSIKRPRKIVIMVKAGGPTDAVIDSLVPLLEPDDIIIDGGNAKWTDTIRREKALAARELRFIGSGVSGGEEGARFGPSLMPGGAREAYESLRPIWEAIAAKVDPLSGKPIGGAAPGQPVEGGVPCTTYIGENGAGHYVKMVHNGIEYGDMQIICEAYHLLREVLGMSAAEMSEVFSTWNNGTLDSFLIEITADILEQSDPRDDSRAFVDIVLDAAGQKGTGKWTSVSALDMGVPAPTIAEAVFARCISAIKEERVAASKVLSGPRERPTFDRDGFIRAVHDALYCSKICPMPKASPSCGRRRRSMAGSWTSAPSPRSGGAAASSAPSSCRRSPRPTVGTRRSRTCCSTPFSRACSMRRRPTGGVWWPWPPLPASRALLQQCAGLLRQLPLRAPAPEPPAGPA